MKNNIVDGQDGQDGLRRTRQTRRTKTVIHCFGVFFYMYCACIMFLVYTCKPICYSGCVQNIVLFLKREEFIFKITSRLRLTLT